MLEATEKNLSEIEEEFKRITKDKMDGYPKWLFQDTQGKSASNQEQYFQNYTVAGIQRIHVNFKSHQVLGGQMIWFKVLSSHQENTLVQHLIHGQIKESPKSPSSYSTNRCPRWVGPQTEAMSDRKIKSTTAIRLYLLEIPCVQPFKNEVKIYFWI